MTASGLYQKHTYLARFVASQFFLPNCDHDDVLQECRLALWEACRTYKPERGPFKPWANTVIRNHMLEQVRKAGRRRGIAQMVELVDVHEAPEPPPSLTRLIRAFRLLTDLERESLVRMLNGEPQNQSTQNAVARARKKLKEAA